MKILLHSPKLHPFIKLTKKLQKSQNSVEFCHYHEKIPYFAQIIPYDVLIFFQSKKHDYKGIDLTRLLRKRKNLIPIIIISDQKDSLLKIDSLDSGADSYVSYPFKLEELLAHIRAAKRRHHELENSQLKLSDLTFNTNNKECKIGQNLIKLSPKESQVLEYLMQHKGHVVTRSQLIAQIWDRHSSPLTNVIDVYIRNIRHKIEKLHKKRIIHTIHGFGYQLGEQKYC